MELTSRERLKLTLQRKEADRVPTFEWLIDKQVINAIAPGATYEEFVYLMGHDALCVDLNYRSERIGGDLIRDEWGMIKKFTKESHSFPVDGPIKSMADLEKYTPPDPKDPIRCKSLDEYLAKYGKEKAVILHLNDVWSIPSRMMPFDDFLMNIYDEPELIAGLVKMSVDANIALAKEAVRHGVEFVYTGDDYAYNNGPMCSPELFGELFAPELKRCVQAYKELGLFVIKHTDGYIMSIIDYILDAGFDCLDPIDPIAGMSLETIKKTYGSRIAIKGNVDCAHTLTFKTPEETAEETLRCLKIGAPGGGYILSSSNTIHSAVKGDNYIAMLDTLRKYGNYPLQF